MTLISIDQTGFDQRQKNMTHAMIATLLYKQGVEHGGIKKLRDGEFEVDTDTEIAITAEDVLAQLAEEDARQVAAEAVAKSDLMVLKERIAQAGSIEEVRVIFDEVWPAI